MIVQGANFPKSLNPRNIDKSFSDIRVRFMFESSFWISVSGWKLTIQPDIQPANPCQSKFLTCYCFSVILLHRINKWSLVLTFLRFVV